MNVTRIYFVYFFQPDNAAPQYIQPEIILDKLTCTSCKTASHGRRLVGFAGKCSVWNPVRGHGAEVVCFVWTQMFYSGGAKWRVAGQCNVWEVPMHFRLKVSWLNLDSLNILQQRRTRHVFCKSPCSNTLKLKMTSPYFIQKSCAVSLAGTRAKTRSITLSGLKTRVSKQQDLAGSTVHVKEENEDFRISESERDNHSSASAVQPIGAV